MKRVARRARYDKDTIYGILDEGLVCHVALSLEDGPHVTPMIYGRAGDRLYLHGSRQGGVVSALQSGAEACVNVTLTDGIVLARTWTGHSMRYRSVTLYGTASVVADRDKLIHALRVITEHVVPGRCRDLPELTDDELGHVEVMSMPIEEVSAKVTAEWAHDGDAQPGIWTGVIPLTMKAQAPVDDPSLPPGIHPPPYVTNYRRPAP